jgi:hypothetical protein
MEVEDESSGEPGALSVGETLVHEEGWRLFEFALTALVKTRLVLNCNDRRYIV